ncbi:MAG: GGDEF domain-containing protein [Rhodocyclaceae bacterium]
MTVFPLQQRFASYTACQLSLVEHLRNIAGERDRTKLGGALLHMLKDVLDIEASTLFRHVVRKDSRFVIPLAECSRDRLTTHDAYLLSPARGTVLAPQSLMTSCADVGKPVSEVTEDQRVYVFPVFQKEAIHLFVELKRKQALGDSDIALTESLLEFFSNHLALINYAETDTLTSLLNRKTFDEHLDRALATASDRRNPTDNTGQVQQRQTPSTEAHNWLAVIDIDHFKRVNDTYGHLIGDEVLLLIAQRMQDTFRMDDQLFRFGGEEFVAILQQTGLSEAYAVFNRLRSIIEAYEFPMVGKMTVSMGFTQMTYFDNPPDLIDRADKALYYAKENGRNRVESYEALQAAGFLEAEHGNQKSDIELF